jgi:hypothetical protein
MSGDSPCSTNLDAFATERRVAFRLLLPMVWASLVVSCLFAETAFGADAPSPPSKQAIIPEVVRVANKFIDHGPCEPSRAEPSVVATMSPYTTDVAAGRGSAEYAVLWSGDIDCRNGSGTNTMNFLLVEKRGAAAARIVGLGEIIGAASVERIVAVTPDSLTIDVYTWGPDDAHCCASLYERWTLHREPDVQTVYKGRYTLKMVDSKPAEPVPLRPGEKRLPTAQ